MTRQPDRPKRPCPPSISSDERVEPTALDTGTATMNRAVAFARCLAGNQNVRYRMMPGKKPASAIPSRNRRTISAVSSGTNATAVLRTPQVIMMRASQRRPPNRLSAMLLGTSNSR